MYYHSVGKQAGQFLPDFQNKFTLWGIQGLSVGLAGSCLLGRAEPSSSMATSDYVQVHVCKALHAEKIFFFNFRWSCNLDTHFFQPFKKNFWFVVWFWFFGRSFLVFGCFFKFMVCSFWFCLFVCILKFFQKFFVCTNLYIWGRSTSKSHSDGF